MLVAIRASPSTTSLSRNHQHQNTIFRRNVSKMDTSCTICKKPEGKSCEGCRETPVLPFNFHNTRVTNSTYYCGKECQKKHVSYLTTNSLVDFMAEQTLQNAIPISGSSESSPANTRFLLSTVANPPQNLPNLPSSPQSLPRCFYPSASLSRLSRHYFR